MSWGEQNTIYAAVTISHSLFNPGTPYKCPKLHEKLSPISFVNANPFFVSHLSILFNQLHGIVVISTKLRYKSSSN